jgi:hypothetical protein
MTLKVNRRELRQETIKYLVRDEAFRLIKGLTADELHTLVELVLRARAAAIQEIRVKQGEAPKQL